MRIVRVYLYVLYAFIAKSQGTAEMFPLFSPESIAGASLKSVSSDPSGDTWDLYRGSHLANRGQPVLFKSWCSQEGEFTVPFIPQLKVPTSQLLRVLEARCKAGTVTSILLILKE
jgi:hypothetical protein